MAAPKRIDELTAGGTLSAAAAVAVVMAGNTVQVAASKFITEAESFSAEAAGAVARTPASKMGERVDITDYMTKAQIADAQLASPTLDHATAMSKAIAKVMGTQGSIKTYGGEIYIPGGLQINLLTDPFGVLPHDGTTGGVPDQASLRIYGAGCGGQGTTDVFATNGASQINFAYTTSNNAKIDTRGRGRLEIDHLVLKDTSGNAEAFIHTTNTVVLIHDNEFVGSKTSSWDQDCIILGGTSTTIDETSDAPFQGYGSQIYNNDFHKIRRAVYLRVYANGVPIHHNKIWKNCGFTTGAAIEYHGDPASVTVETISGTPIHHNLIEVENYKYGVQCTEVSASTLGPNDFYDPSATTTAYYTFGNGAVYNHVIGGMHSDTKTFVEESGTAANTNSYITAHQSQETRHMQPFTVGSTLKRKNYSSTTVIFLTGENSAGDTIEGVYTGTTDNFTVRHTPSGGSTQDIITARDFGSGTIIWTIPGTDCRIRASSDLIILDDAVQSNGNVTMNGVTYLRVAILSDANRGAAGTNGRIIFNTTDGNLNIDNGTNWILPDGTVT